MSLVDIDRFPGFRTTKAETDFLRYFYKNTIPTGMDKYKSVLVNTQRGADDLKKSLSNNEKNRVKNSIDIRSKLSNIGRDKTNEISMHSQYEIYAMLAVSGRHS